MATAPVAIPAPSDRTRTILEDEFFTREQLAEELHVTTRTIARWAVLRVGPPITRIGRSVLYRKSSVSAWLAAQETKTARPQASRSCRR